MESSSDEFWMKKALALARKALGTTAPNPVVGCLIVQDGQIVGQGVTQPGGRPHAEIMALQAAKKKSKGATVYSTLEPCNHYGKTGPCSQALIKAGVAKVVIATIDPHKDVCGTGIKALKSAGIKVKLHVCEEEAKKLNIGFLTVVNKQRPFVSLKLATSLDGKIATQTGESQWITSKEAREHVHKVRARFDAIMVGIGTVLADNPALTCRIKGMEDRSPIRIVADSHLRIPPDCQLIKSSPDVPCWLLTCKPDNNTLPSTVRILSCPANNDNLVDLDHALKTIATAGVTRLLVEGGSTLASSLLTLGLVDELTWIRAPIILGAEGTSAIGNLDIHTLKEGISLTRTHTQDIGTNMIEIFKINR